ncbi:hypothetical protein L204_104990 [Cryptococcus depauperatus]
MDWWPTRVRPLANATLCSFLCFLVTTVKPWARIHGQWGFLVYTSMLIFFFPKGRIGSQIEATVLGVFGGTIGITWSYVTLTVAAYCGRRYGADSNQARAIMGVGLAMLCLASGLVRSYARRFNAFSKIMVFFPIFMLTSQQSIIHMSTHLFLEQFYVVIFSAVLPLVSTLLLAPHLSSSGQTHLQVENSLRTIRTLLPISFCSLLGEGVTPGTLGSQASMASVRQLEDQFGSTFPPLHQEQLAQKLRTAIASLRVSNGSYFKIATSVDTQLSASADIVKVLRRIARNSLLNPTSYMPGERIQAALNKSFPQSQSEILHHRKNLRHFERTSKLPITPESGTVIERITRRKPRHLAGYMLPRTSNPSSILSNRPDLKDHSHHLVIAIVDALRATEGQLAFKFGWSKTTRENKEEVKNLEKKLQDASNQLEEELNHVQRTLTSLLGDESNLGHTSLNDQPQHSPTQNSNNTIEAHAVFMESTDVKSILFDRDRYRLAFYMTSLLDLARDIYNLTTIVQSAPKYQTPSNSWARFIQVLWTNCCEHVNDKADAQGEETELVLEKEQPLAEQKEYLDMDFVTASLHQSHTSISSMDTRHYLQQVWMQIWNQSRVVKARIIFSRLMHSLKHSRHVLFSLKLAGGICLLSIPAWMPSDYPARHWYDASRGGWMVVSYMFVLEDTTGAILKVGFFRSLGTLIGAVTGYVCVLIAKQNPYALIVLATTCSVPISWNVLFASVPGFGVATGIALPPILFIPYLNLSNGETNFFLAWNRFVDIVIGVVAAILVGTWIWPVHARVQYFRSAAEILSRIAEYYLHMSRDLVRSSLVYRVDDKQYESLEVKIRRGLQLARALVAIQKQEVSLLPRPIKLYSEIIDASERLLETLIEIRTLRFSVPRKETVLDVLSIRRELISTVLNNLWTCSHAFGSRGSLPQFLPSPRVPLLELMEVTEEHARHLQAMRYAQQHQTEEENGSIEKDSNASISTTSYQAELAFLYGMAEDEALGEVCNILEELIAAARTLFGSHTFLYT